jgi:hypothetical protein
MLAPSAAELNIIDYMPGGAQIEPQRGNPSRFLADPLTTQEQLLTVIDFFMFPMLPIGCLQIWAILQLREEPHNIGGIFKATSII